MKQAIRAKLLSGKLSQPTQTFHVTRAMTRAFEQVEWKLLEEKLVSWRSGLVSVLEVVANARKSTQVSVGATVVQLGVPVVHGDLAKEVPTAVVS
jgi:translation initiation factor 3 subunit M